MGRKKKFNDRPFPYRTEIELEISTLTNLGVGLGRVPLPGVQPSALSIQPTQPLGGWVVMVPFTLPGERVRARVYRNHRNFSEADLLEVLAPSPHRVAPRCPLFGRCGGCQYQHLAYPEQLAWKRRQVEELLRHMAGIEFPVAPTTPSPREFGYRSKITPHFQVRATRNAEGGTPDHQQPRLQPSASTGGADAPPPIGFLRQGSRFELVDVPQCPIATPEINARLTEVRAEVRRRLAAGSYARGATLLLRHAQEGVVTDWDAVIHEVVPRSPCHLLGDKPDGATSETTGAPPEKCNLLGYTFAGAPPSALDVQSGATRAAAAPLRLHFLARDFFQNNPFILPTFTGHVRAQAAATGARYLVDA
ncbi:MAG: SAM-dependent methyltransferase, partial [Opitutus sp.]|nr:SAM-dependent methyltransferase [Opitutus sp.]